jgi:hypothetical protein
MNRFRVPAAIVALFLAAAGAWAQKPKPLVYEVGPTMVDLVLQQKAYEGASPAELEGMRQGIELALSESAISVVLVDDQRLRVAANGEEQEFQYRKEGLRLKVRNLQTGEYMELGFFSKDGKKLTLATGAILDLAQ